MWLKLGQVCFTASLDLAGNNNSHQKSSTNHTFKSRWCFSKLLVNSIDTFRAEANLVLNEETTGFGLMRAEQRWTVTRPNEKGNDTRVFGIRLLLGPIGNLIRIRKHGRIDLMTLLT